MSDGFQRNHGRRQEDASQEEQLAKTQRELDLTKAMLHLTELRLNIALGMPVDQLRRAAQAVDSQTFRFGASHDHT
jgi:hypothetical protein